MVPFSPPPPLFPSKSIGGENERIRRRVCACASARACAHVDTFTWMTNCARVKVDLRTKRTNKKKREKENQETHCTCWKPPRLIAHTRHSFYVRVQRFVYCCMCAFARVSSRNIHPAHRLCQNNRDNKKKLIGPNRRIQIQKNVNAWRRIVNEK